MLKKLLSYLVIIILIFTKQSNASTPNILFLFSDDQCWDTIGIIGNEVETPNLDKMVKNGVFLRMRIIAEHGKEPFAWLVEQC